MNPPKSGFVFGSMDGTGGGSSNSLSLGATSSSTFGSSPVLGTTGGGEAGMPTAMFSSLEKANPAAPATFSKPAEVVLQPAPPATNPQAGTAQLKTSGVQQPASPRPRQDDKLTTSSGDTTVKSWSGPPFGDGPTAVQGARLNKLFANWISHQISTNSATPLDVGLRDYVAFAGDIRDRVEFSRAGVESTTGTAFKHPSAPVASPTKPPVASTSPSAVDSAAILPPVAAQSSPPAPPPALVVKSAPTGLFTQSILPAAPPGPRFAFAATSASTAAAPPAVIAPSTSSPNGGFTFSAGGFGGTGSATPGTPGYQGPFPGEAGSRCSRLGGAQVHEARITMSKVHMHATFYKVFSTSCIMQYCCCFWFRQVCSSWLRVDFGLIIPYHTPCIIPLGQTSGCEPE